MDSEEVNDVIGVGCIVKKMKELKAGVSVSLSVGCEDAVPLGEVSNPVFA
jgi:hypothetical protein